MHNRIPFHIVCIDWSKHEDKRRGWWQEKDTNLIKPLSIGNLTLESILESFKHTDGPTLIGIDAAMGAPYKVIQQFSVDQEKNPTGFFDWITWLFEFGHPDNPVSTPEEWHYSRPFIHIPPGKGSKIAFKHFGVPLHRDVEAGLNSNSPLIVSGIPGTVGSGSRELWREFCSLNIRDASNISFWPYDGDLKHLLMNNQIVLAEIYPKACYGIALGDSLPTKLVALAKTRQNTREKTINSLQEKYLHYLDISDLDQCRNNEDEFDAMISVVALHRLFNSNLSVRPKGPAFSSEGGVLGKEALSLN